MTNKLTVCIRDQNDRFRKLDPEVPGQILFTQGVATLIEQSDATNAKDLLTAIGAFDDFDADNDPHGEHDFGSLRFANAKLFWKIDLYDETYTFGSSEPASLSKTRRVLTVMLPQEY